MPQSPLLRCPQQATLTALTSAASCHQVWLGGGLGPVGAAEAGCVCASQLQLEEWGVKVEGWEPCVCASLQHGLCPPSSPGGFSACVWVCEGGFLLHGT